MKQKAWGIYYHGVLKSIMDTDNEQEVIDIMQALRRCSTEPVPSIDYREIKSGGDKLSPAASEAATEKEGVKV